ncbi:FtsX-like permease family protein [Lactobacillus gasseri]|jgi:antimicrobial peptide ABC transporter, permease protein|uniref:ABC transporter permease n=1 Tax=Lactobacillus TaxID=1578 RepID=UPI000665956B|nr:MULTISPECIES: FtsX-like permease family protein [Lactobacillus]KXA26273.1 efflux ABC transporter, permease protein [Lactobacillus gasseri]MCT7705511.1 FtsX-like permease family protein [Lactobacillus gasseri]MCT7749812.1 FtsX-like permease family protein [Lactobacillus gasseri]MCT7895023.1 FtsX-like permease family protein [Lactobacillus gasseri]MCZ3484792.1 FtsX-like permease family protein [Lactobacillus gasseri]
MLWKLSLTGIKSRFKDYLVLFSGLTFASAIFYMFMTLATNPAFLKGSLSIAFQITQIVFGFGIALLSIITFVYIVYANSFLLSMRQKDYGMYMMLGARTSKIGRLIFTETLVVGLLATLLGTVLGVALTQGVSSILISQLGLQIHKFVGFYLPALLWTIAFFAILFFLAAFWNRHKLVKSNIINLLHEDQKPVKLHRNKLWKFIEALLGIALLATGYWAMMHAAKLGTKTVPIAFFTIVFGSYFTFDSFFTAIIDLLRKNLSFKYRKLHSFTLGQLKFRLSDYTRILSTVSLLFALALGAITVGLNFNNMTEQAMQSTYYDVVLYNRNQKVDNQLKKVSVKSTTHFDYKMVVESKGKEKNRVLYISENQLKNNKIMYQHYSRKNDVNHYDTRRLTVNDFKNKKSDVAAEGEYQLVSLTPYIDAQAKVVSQAQYDQIKAKVNKIELLRVNNFRSNFNNIEKLQKLSVNQMISSPEAEKDGINVNLSNSKSAQYRLVSSMTSGFEFMGFFLGLAFLAMLASTLMFKVLSGANSDKPRYQMLWKVGTRKSLLKSSITKEIGILFALPAVLGVVDVLFGLQLFKSILGMNTYDKLWIPFTIFGVLYVIYYLLTVILYQHIVLQKED